MSHRSLMPPPDPRWGCTSELGNAAEVTCPPYRVVMDDPGDIHLLVRKLGGQAERPVVVEWEPVDGGWRRVDDDLDLDPVALDEVLHFGLADRLEITTNGLVDREVVVQALAPADVLVGDEALAEIDGLLLGPFADAGWLEVDRAWLERGVLLPAHRLLVTFTVVDATEAAFRWVELLGQVRPGLLVRYWDHSHGERWDELIECPATELDLWAVREVLALATGDAALEEAIRRAIAGDGTAWRADELVADESRAVSIGVRIDPAVAAALRPNS